MEYSYKSVIKNTIKFLLNYDSLRHGLNNLNFLNKKSELIYTCCHENELLLKKFKKNRYSERKNTIDIFR